MKKIVKTLSLVLSVCLLLTVFAGAKVTVKTHVVEELDLELTLPADMPVYDKTALQGELSEEELDELLGMTDLTGDLADAGIYLYFGDLNAEKAEDFFVGTVVMADMAVLEGANGYGMDRMSDDELDLMIGIYDAIFDYVEQDGVKLGVKLYRNDQLPYIQTSMTIKSGGESLWMESYSTTEGNKTYCISFLGSANKYKAVAAEIMDSVRLNQSTWSESGFSDMAGHWAEAEVTKAVELGLFSGTTKNTFSPDASMTRAMLVQALYRMEKEPKVKEAADFSDVDDDAWYADAVSWAAAKEIVTGSDGKFDPDGVLSREQLCAILWRYAKSEKRDVSAGEDTNILSYNDAFAIAEYAIPAMQWACGEGLISGVGDGYLAPQASATRAQVAAILVRYLGK